MPHPPSPLMRAAVLDLHRPEADAPAGLHGGLLLSFMIRLAGDALLLLSRGGDFGVGQGSPLRRSRD